VPTGSNNKHSQETLRVVVSSDVFLSVPSFTGYEAEQVMVNPSCSSDRAMIFWIFVVKVRSVFSSIMAGASCWRFQVSLGGECGQGVDAEQLTETHSFSFRAAGISILGFGAESVVSNHTFHTLFVPVINNICKLDPPYCESQPETCGKTSSWDVQTQIHVDVSKFMWILSSAGDKSDGGMELGTSQC